jgi:hypothetical protein
MKEIYGALAKAQENFEAALKNATNPHFRSKYAGLDACVEAVRTALNEQGIFLTQTIESVEAGILVETLFAHESGESYSGGKLFMPVSKHDAQGYGSAITYGRRYSLLTACGVAPEDDDGNGASKDNAKDEIDISRMNDFLVAISESETVDQLKKVYAEAYAACAGNQAWQAKVIAAKNKRKEGK